MFDRKWHVLDRKSLSGDSRKSFILNRLTAYDEAHGLLLHVFNNLAISYDQAHKNYDEAHGPSRVHKHGNYPVFISLVAFFNRSSISPIGNGNHIGLVFGIGNGPWRPLFAAAMCLIIKL